MFRLSTCLLLLVACHGSNPPAEPEPGATPPIDPDTEPSTLPPEPNSQPPAPNSLVIQPIGIDCRFFHLCTGSACSL